MKQNFDDFVLVAKLGKTVGLNGFVKLHILSDFENQFKSGAVYYDNHQKPLTIKQINRQNQTVQIVGYESVDLAKALVNLELFDTKENTRKRFKLKNGEFFYFDVIGKEVWEGEKKLGYVNDILEISNQFLFEVNTDESLVLNGFSKMFYIPYVDRYILKIQDCIYTQNAVSILENS